MRFPNPVLPVPDLTLDDFDYELPPELIAQTPAADRTASRLLHLDAQGGLHDRRFADLPGLLRPNDLLVFNDTRVIKARLFGEKAAAARWKCWSNASPNPTGRWCTCAPASRPRPAR